jgi:predicted O-methyltransferase YrrM
MVAGNLARGARRRLAMGLATVLGLAPQGFFIPYRHARSVRPEPYPALEAQFAAAAPRFLAILDAMDRHAGALAAMAGPAPRPRLDQAWFPSLDAAAAYAMVRAHRPRRIIEIGSGHSTRILAAAIAEGGLATALTCIDPAPRAALAGLPVEWLPAVLQAVPPDRFAGLAASDMLFVDSSHILMPGSDVDLVLNRILPRLPPGVLIHVHDVFLPDAYPASWTWRGYNEQSAVAALLQGGAYQLRFASRYVATRLQARLDAGIVARLPDRWAALASSLWLEKAA